MSPQVGVRYIAPRPPGIVLWLAGAADNMRRERIIVRVDYQGFFGVDVPLTHRGSSKVVTARGREHCPPRRFKGIYPGSRIGRWVRELRAECEGVKGKAESDARMSR